MYSIKPNPYNRGVIINLQGSLHNARRGLRKGWSEWGKLLVETAKNGIKKGPKTGRYYIYKSRRIRASAPGEYPANRSGNLRRGVGFQIQGQEKMEFGLEANYGKFLEDGTKIMEKRPTLAQSDKKNRHKAEQLVGNIVLKEIIRK